MHCDTGMWGVWACAEQQQGKLLKQDEEAEPEGPGPYAQLDSGGHAAARQRWGGYRLHRSCTAAHA